MDDRQCNMYPGNKNGPVENRNQESNDRILIGLSVFNIFLWLLCTTFSAMILIRFNPPNSLIRFASLDLISPGVWGSLFYGLGGILGICAAYEKRQPLLVGTLVLAMLSIFSSLGIAAVSGAMAISPRFRSYHNSTWLGLEWTLLVLSIMGFLVNLSAFIAVSVIICRPTCCPNKANSCRLQPQVFANSSNTNYMSGETVNMSMPPPPPPGFHINPPLPQPQHNQQHHQQRGYSSSPLPRVLVSADTNI